MHGHCDAGAVKRLFGCAAGPSRSFGHGSPRQSVSAAGVGPSMPSHHGAPSGVIATFVKIVLRCTVASALGLVLELVPGATPKNPASGLIAHSRPSSPTRSHAMSSPTVVTFHPACDAGGRRGADGAHQVRHDVHRSALHRAVEERPHLRARVRGRHPVVRRARVGLRFRADEREVLGARDVRRVAPVEEAPRLRFLVQRDERTLREHRVEQGPVLLFGPVAPHDFFRLGPKGDLVNPRGKALIRRVRRA